MRLRTLLLMTLAALAMIGASRGHAAQIYWCGGGDVYRANLDGSNVEHLLEFDPGPGTLVDVALHLVGSKMYLADTSGGQILRANLDGTSLEQIVTGLEYLHGIALDTVSEKVYWTKGGESDAIQRANLDGSDVQDVLNPAWLSSPHRLAVDPFGETTYWTGWAQGSWAIRRVDFNGANVQDIVLHQEWPFGIALDIDSGKIYWADSGDSYEDPAAIRRCNLDGTDVEDLFTDARATRGLALDLLRGKVYWAQSYPGEIWRANLDGSNAELVLSGLYSPQGIAIDPYPIPEPCSGVLLCMAGFVFFLVLHVRKRVLST